MWITADTLSVVETIPAMQTTHHEYWNPPHTHCVAVRELANNCVVDAQKHARPSNDDLQPQINAFFRYLWDEIRLGRSE